LRSQNKKTRITALILSGLLLGQSGITASAANYVQQERSQFGQFSQGQLFRAAASTELVVGQTYQGFTLKSKSISKDLDSQVYEFIHEKSGCKLIYFQNEDKNKWFNIAFRTPTVDDTGVNHIIEHTVLEASEKYNFKSPFTEMGKRSVSTYMNAFTGSDVTSYPVASENAQDFQNLMSVYLDAVFAPLVVKNDKLLQQEGWRYEIDEATGKIGLNGVVFNEMKGALSEKNDSIFTALQKLLYPDTKYRFNSGGDPEAVIDLTQEQLVSTYKRHYNPSNACIMLYGKMDPQEKLKYIQDNYLSKYEKAAEIKDDKVQPGYKETKTVTLSYPADASATAKNDSVLTWNLVLNGTTVMDRLGLQILASVLGAGENSPLYKKTVEQGIGQNVQVSLDTSYYQPAFTIMLDGADEKDRQKFEDAIISTLKEQQEKGIDKDRIQAVMNSFELSFKGALLSANKGEMAIGIVNGGFITYGDPLLNMNQSDELAKIKEESQKNAYLEGLISKYLMGNKNLTVATFTPDANYMADMEERIDQKLEERLKKMSEAELAALKQKSEAYVKWQAEPMDLRALESLPSLKISDLDLTPRKRTLTEKKLDGITLYEHQESTLGLTRLELDFNLKTLTQKELTYIELFGKVLGNADTKNHGNDDLWNQINMNTGGFGYGPAYLAKSADPKHVYTYYTLEPVFASEKSETAMALMKELMLNAKLSDKKLVKTKLQDLVDELKQYKLNNAAETADSRLRASLTKTGAMQDYLLNDGMKVLLKAEKNFDKEYPEIEKTLLSIYRKVFNGNGLVCSITSDQAGVAAGEIYLEALSKALSKERLAEKTWKINPYSQKTGLLIPAEVQYVNIGFNQRNLGEKVKGSDFVFAQMLNDGYVYENIRVMGGAYGGYFSVSLDGQVVFSTYRDPNLKESVDVMKNMTKYLKTFKSSQEEIDRAIISIAGRMELGADLFAEIVNQDHKRLTGSDETLREQLKKEILATTSADLPGFLAKLEKGMKNSSMVVAGSSKQIKKNKKLFTEIRNIQNK